MLFPLIYVRYVLYILHVGLTLLQRSFFELGSVSDHVGPVHKTRKVVDPGVLSNRIRNEAPSRNEKLILKRLNLSSVKEFHVYRNYHVRDGLFVKTTNNQFKTEPTVVKVRTLSGDHHFIVVHDFVHWKEGETCYTMARGKLLEITDDNFGGRIFKVGSLQLIDAVAIVAAVSARVHP